MAQVGTFMGTALALWGTKNMLACWPCMFRLWRAWSECTRPSPLTTATSPGTALVARTVFFSNSSQDAQLNSKQSSKISVPHAKRPRIGIEKPPGDLPPPHAPLQGMLVLLVSTVKNIASVPYRKILFYLQQEWFISFRRQKNAE